MALWTSIGLALAAAFIGHAWGWHRRHGEAVIKAVEVSQGKKGNWRWFGFDSSGSRRNSCFPLFFSTGEIAADDARAVHPGVRVVILPMLLILALAAGAEAQSLRETLEGLGRDVAGEVVRDAADRIDGGVTEPEPSAPVRQVNISNPPALPAPVEDEGLSRDTIIVLAGMGFLGLMMIVVGLMSQSRNQGGETTLAPSHSRTSEKTRTP